MSFWNIHFLNARHDLTRVLSQVRAVARDSVARVGEHADLPDFDLVVRAGADVIPGWGLAGRAPAPGRIEIALQPDRLDEARLLRILVHELHHLLRWEGPGYGRSLGEALVSEGLAGHFVMQVLGGNPDPWDATQPPAGLARRAMNEWARLDYDHARWFFGKGDLRKWAGYGLGHRLVAEYLVLYPDQDAALLAKQKADSFRPAMRRIAAADGAPEDEGADAEGPEGAAQPSAVATERPDAPGTEDPGKPDQN